MKPEIALVDRVACLGALPPLPKRPKVAIAIPVLNEAKTLSAVLNQVLKSAPDGAEIFVVDGGSTDGTQKIALSYAPYGIRLLHNPKKLQSAGLNLAAQHARADCDVLVRCDAHQIYPRKFVTRLLYAMQLTNAESVVVTMNSRGVTPLQRAVAWVSNSVIGNGGAKHRSHSASGYVDHGHHAAFRMAAFKAVGGYDPSFSHNEDAEFDCRLGRAGGKIYLDASIALTYFPRRSLADLWRQYLKYGRGRGRTIKRHPHALRARQLAVPANLFVQALSVALAFLSPLALLVPASYLAALGAFSALETIRRKDWAGVLCAPAALTMHTAWALGFLASVLSPEASARALPVSPLPNAAESAFAEAGAQAVRRARM